jgi:putative MATE family efflux protein
MAGQRVIKELGRYPIAPLLWKYSLPSIVGMLVSALYNVVDRLYVGRCVGPDGLAGFALTFPAMMITVAFGTLIGHGTATRISIAMGQGKRKVAQCYLGQAICLFIILSLTLYPLCALLVEPIFLLAGGTPAIVKHAAPYMQIVYCTVFFQYLAHALNNTLRADGFPRKALISMLLGAIINTIIDPFFIFDEVPLGFCTVPGLNLGIVGAAIATVLSQIVTAIWVLSHFLGKDTSIPLKWGYIKLYKPLLGGMLFLGLPPFALNLVGSGVNTLYNILFRHYAPTESVAECEIAAIGIIMTIQMLLGMPVLGVAMGMQPLLGFNTGARNYLRVRQTFHLAAWWGGAWIFVVSILTIVFKEPIFRLFCREDMAAELLATGPSRMMVFFCGFQFVGYAIVVGQYFQAIGRGFISLTMSLSRQCFLLVPLMFLMPRLVGPIGVWWAAPISDVLSILMALGFHIMEHRRINRLLAETSVIPA